MKMNEMDQKKTSNELKWIEITQNEWNYQK